MRARRSPRAGDAVRETRLKIHGPSGKGWTASISPASAASLSVLGVTSPESAATAQVQPGLDAVFGWSVDGNAVVRPQGRDAFAGPAVAMAGDKAIPVEDAGDQIIIGDQDQLADGGDNLGRGAVALTAPPFRQAQFGMHATDPVDQQARSRPHPDRYRRQSPG